MIARAHVGVQFLNATFAGVSEAQIVGIGPLGSGMTDAGEHRRTGLHLSSLRRC